MAQKSRPQDDYMEVTVVMQVTFTSMRVVVAEGPPEKDPASEVDTLAVTGPWVVFRHLTQSISRAGSFSGGSSVRSTATAGDQDLPDRHSTVATRSTSTDRDYLALVWFCFRLLQLFSSCVAFWLVTPGFQKWGVGYKAINTCAMLIWFLSLPISLIVVIVELCNIQSHFPFSYHMPLTDACFAAHVCLSPFLVQSIQRVQFLPWDPFISRVNTALTFTSIMCFLYGLELSCTWNCYKLKDLTCAVYTTQGVLKVLEMFVACVIFALISNTSRHLKEPAHGWGLAIYCICFAQATVATLLNLGNWEYRLPVQLTLLSVLLYSTALVLWWLYPVGEEIKDKPEGFWDVLRLTHCSSRRDYRPAVAFLTAINLLIYVADLVISAH
ncbi:myeloid-associated differentiation marker-like [Oryx dammah]|uniref:myeloid-associated differentiation marker-like n=1 Tax=Oryx dammah TaxID=59534 RepID=UPI001A9AA64F|nr:myeloid-associated differentiation marker-like [Oryx dammah]